MSAEKTKTCMVFYLDIQLERHILRINHKLICPDYNDYKTPPSVEVGEGSPHNDDADDAFLFYSLLYPFLLLTSGKGKTY